MYDFGLITKPRLSHNRLWGRPGHDEEAQSGPDVGKTTPARIQKQPVQTESAALLTTDSIEDRNGLVQKA